jgi:hypothetical protein
VGHTSHSRRERGDFRRFCVEVSDRQWFQPDPTRSLGRQFRDARSLRTMVATSHLSIPARKPAAYRDQHVGDVERGAADRAALR